MMKEMMGDISEVQRTWLFAGRVGGTIMRSEIVGILRQCYQDTRFYPLDSWTIPELMRALNSAGSNTSVVTMTHKSRGTLEKAVSDLGHPYRGLENEFVPKEVLIHVRLITHHYSI
jgi:hypothetical protein